MPKKFIKRFIPDPKRFREQKALGFLGERVFNPNVWHINRRSVTSAVTIGLFMAFVPIPGQMVLAAASAIAVRANLPISVALVWITNPVTMPPIFYFAYLLGSFLLQQEANVQIATSGWSSFFNAGMDIAIAFLFGCLVLGIFFSTLGNLGTRILWRYWVVRNWSLRRKQTKQKGVSQDQAR